MAADHGAGQAILPCKHVGLAWGNKITSWEAGGGDWGSTGLSLPHPTSTCRATLYCQVLWLQHASFHLHSAFHLCSSILGAFKFSLSTHRLSACRATRRRKGSFVLPSPSAFTVSTLSLAARASCHGPKCSFRNYCAAFKRQPDSYKPILGDDSSRWHVLVFLF